MKDYDAANKKFFFIRKIDYICNIIMFFWLVITFFALIFNFQLFKQSFTLLLLVSFLLGSWELAAYYRFRKKYRQEQLATKSKWPN
ncbi:hypothetical protein [Vagococcus salmoninarum]|uniref:hypothetical protein n=1 Tax=Vagococcus salmoninarum TaxID=2739 RepID=UPI00188090C1|nr:hypothetical protein [Vagococcus salmoninarum]MBE9390192.1 hypothetical protein [Vagococcus salmoninarum]